MRVFRSLEAVPSLSRGTALAIGNFDGLHRGHREILHLLVTQARASGRPACVLTFSPHPERFFKSRPISMIQTLDQRLDGIAKEGIDLAFVIPFDRPFARLSAEAFVRRVLVRTLRARLVIIGRGFRFGRGREGDVALLGKMGRAAGFETLPVPPVSWSGRAVSSSLIRDMLSRGRVGTARRLLGRPFEIEGDVIRGAGRGHRLGFPTANIETPNEILPRGVFFTRFRVDSKDHPALTSIGVRPTFGLNDLSIETYVLRFRKDIYGEAVKVFFLRKLRDEKSYAGASELTAQLRKDREAGKRYFEL